MRRFVTKTIILLTLTGTFPLSTVANQSQRSLSSTEKFSETNDNKLSNELLAKLKIYQTTLISGSKKFSLEETLILCFQNNPNLKYYKTNVESKYYQLYASKLLWMPTISVYNSQTPSFGRYSSKTVSTTDTSNSTSKSQYNVITPGVQLTWNFLMPTRSPYINFNLKQLESSQYIYLTAVRNQLLSAQSAYYQVQANYELIKQYTKIYNIQLKQITLMQERYNDKVLDLGSLGQTKAQLYLTLSQLIAYYNQYFVSVANLANVVGLDEETIIIPSSELTQQGTWNLSLNDSINNALAFREEIKNYLSLAEASGFNSEYYLRSYLPVLALYGSTYYSKLSGESQNIYGNASTTSSTIGLNLTWTPFDGGINYQLSKSELALGKGYRSQAELERDLVIQQVRSTYSQFVSSQSNLEATRRAYEASKIGQEVSTVRFNYGVGDITTIVQSLQLLSQAASAFVQAKLDYNNSVASLYRYTSQDIPNIPTNFFINTKTP